MDIDQINEYKVQKIEKSNTYIDDSNYLRYFFDALSAVMAFSLSVIAANPINILITVGSYFSTAMMYKKKRKDAMANSDDVKKIDGAEKFESYRVKRIEKCVKERKSGKKRAIIASIVSACAIGASIIGALPLLPGVALFTAGLANIIDGYQNMQFADADLAILNQPVINNSPVEQPVNNVPSSDGHTNEEERENNNTGGESTSDSDKEDLEGMFKNDELHSVIKDYLKNNISDDANLSSEEADNLTDNFSKKIVDFYKENPAKLAEVMFDGYLDEARKTSTDENSKTK